MRFLNTLKSVLIHLKLQMLYKDFNPLTVFIFSSYWNDA
jgi:hypothetical protein